MHIPTFETDADSYSYSKANDIFVPNIVWNSVRSLQSQIVYGGIGTGKTILLKRISWNAMNINPCYLETHKFFAFYFDMHELWTLSALYSEKSFGGDIRTRKIRDRISSCFITIYMFSSIAYNILQIRKDQPADYLNVELAFLETCKILFEDILDSDFKDITVAHDILCEQQEKLISQIGSINLFNDKALSFTHRITKPINALQIFARKFKKHLNISLCYLLDQFEMLHTDCQNWLTPLLYRENHKLFTTIIACRPFAINLKTSARDLQPLEDFKFTVIEYLPTEKEKYKFLLKSILKKFFNDQAIATKFLGNYFDYYAELSSRSIRLFLELCKTAIIYSESSWESGIKEKTLEKAAEIVSKSFKDKLNSVSGSIQQGDLWKIAIQLKKIANNNIFPDQIQLYSKSHSKAVLNNKSEILLRKAFEEGLLQFASREDVSNQSIPEFFMLSRVIMPSLGISRELPKKKIKVENTLINMISRSVKVSKQKPIKKNSAVNVKKIFLSISFSDLSNPNIARKMFNTTFNDSKIKIITGTARGPGMIDQLYDDIYGTDMTILELSYLKPNIIVEMGLTLGLEKRLVPVCLEDANKSILEEEFHKNPFLASMARIYYNLSKERMLFLKQQVLDWSKKEVGPSHFLKTTLDGKIPLKIKKQQPKAIMLYYPEERANIWENVEKEIERKIENNGYRFYSVCKKPHPRGLTLMENLIWCISKCQRLLIDTSAYKKPDLLGSFGLGFSFAMSKKFNHKQIIRIEEADFANKSGISMWPLDSYRTWKDEKSLNKIIEDFLPS